MNRISFKGRDAVIKDFADRFLSMIERRTLIKEVEYLKFERELKAVARAKKVDLDCLEEVINYLSRHDVPYVRIKELIEERQDELAILAEDIKMLRAYIADGTITGVRVFEDY
jgi:hypothetical protein